MSNATPNYAPTASGRRIAMSDIYPDATYGLEPVVDPCDALEAYRAFDDGDLAAVPQALAAYVGYQQHASAA